MYCKQCGAQNNENAKFCAECGATLTAEEAVVLSAEENADTSVEFDAGYQEAETIGSQAEENTQAAAEENADASVESDAGYQEDATIGLQEKETEESAAEDNTEYPAEENADTSVESDAGYQEDATIGSQVEENTQSATEENADTSVESDAGYQEDATVGLQTEGNEEFAAEENTEYQAEENSGFPQDGNIIFSPDDIAAVSGEKKRKKKGLKWLIAGIIALVLAGICVLGYFFAPDVFNFKKLLGLESKKDPENIPVLYVKDDSVFMKGNNKKNSFELADAEGFYSQNGENDYQTNSEYFKISEDGKVIFFADDIGDDGHFKLYYMKNSDTLFKSDKSVSSVQVDKGVSHFEIAADGSFVIYTKADKKDKKKDKDDEENGENKEQGEKLYLSRLEGEDKEIAKDVYGFILTEDSKKIVFIKPDEKSDDDDYSSNTTFTLYLCGVQEKDKPEKVDSNVLGLVSDLTKDYQKIYYAKKEKKENIDDDYSITLYSKESGKDKVKIASDVYSAGVIGETLYVSKEEETEIKFEDVFEDDCADSDKEIENPSISDYEDDEEYEAAKELYDEKQARDEIRDRYKNDPVKTNSYTLYKFANSKLEKVEENMIDGSTFARSRIIGRKSGDGGKKTDKVKLSTIKNSSDAEDIMFSIIYSTEDSGKEYSLILENGSIIKLDGFDSMPNFRLSKDEKYFYCMEDVDESNKGKLNRYEISSKGLGKKTTLKEGAESFALYDDSVIVYLDKEVGIYENGKYKALAKDKELFKRVIYYSDDEEVKDRAFFYLDNYKEGSGDLYKFVNGNKEKLDSGVHQVTVRTDNLLYYLKDYNTEKEYGDLYKRTDSKSGKKKAKSEKIDSEVMYILN